jgi:hypothetical protein
MQTAHAINRFVQDRKRAADRRAARGCAKRAWDNRNVTTTEAPTAEAHGTREAFDCAVRLPEWKLHVAHLQLREGRDLGNVMDLAMEGARSHLRRGHPDGRLDESDTILAIREDLIGLGVDPRATPPASELLISEFLEKGRITRGTMAWEFLALLTVKSEAPWSVVDRDTIEPPLEWRLGERGESLTTTEGSRDCEGLPVLADRNGVKTSPWDRLAPTELDGCGEPVFVCYLPKRLFRRVEPRAHMGRAVWLTWAYRFIFERTCSYRATTA